VRAVRVVGRVHLHWFVFILGLPARGLRLYREDDYVLCSSPTSRHAIARPQRDTLLVVRSRCSSPASEGTGLMWKLHLAAGKPRSPRRAPVQIDSAVRPPQAGNGGDTACPASRHGERLPPATRQVTRKASAMSSIPATTGGRWQRAGDRMVLGLPIRVHPAAAPASALGRRRSGAAAAAAAPHRPPPHSQSRTAGTLVHKNGANQSQAIHLCTYGQAQAEGDGAALQP